MREAAVYGLTFLITGMVIGNAFHQKKQFYPAVVYMTKSSLSIAVLALQSLALVVLVGKLARKIFFGHLRAAEVEHLMERSWYAVTETCLAFTVFREDFSSTFVAMFVMLLFFKCFHWLAEDRVDYMERSPVLGFIFHARIIGLMIMLGLIDSYFMKSAYLATLAKGASAQLVFGFEYAILFMIVVTVVVKYLLHCIDLYDENPWENKAVYLLYLELFTSAVKFVLYSLFVAVMTKVHTFPLFAIRPLYITMRTFKKSLNDVILSRRAIRNMNQLYPNATEEELRAIDVCIICREQMVLPLGCKKLPCGHIFHASCLRSWFQRQQTCPTCRMEVLNIPQTPAAPAPVAVPPAAPAQAAQPNIAAAVNPWQALQAGIAAGIQARAPPVPPQNLVPPPAYTVPTTSTTTTPTFSSPQMPPFTPPNLDASFAGFPGGVFPGGVFPGGVFPPPFFPVIPFPPPAMPSAQLSALTEEQLRQMEQDERAGIEARIQWLRDIQTLLDAAVEQMNQYTMVMSALNATRQASGLMSTEVRTNRDASYQTSSSVDASIPSASSEGLESNNPSTSRSDEYQGARPKIITSAAKGAEGSSIPENSDEPCTDEFEEVRRKRLAKFGSRTDINPQNQS